MGDWTDAFPAYSSDFFIVLLWLSTLMSGFDIFNKIKKKVIYKMISESPEEK